MYQKTVYSKEEQLWLDNFKDVTLTRDEKTIVRMGYKGQLLSPQNIWDVVEIVDTDYYRQLIEQLRRKGILLSKISREDAMELSRSDIVSVTFPLNEEAGKLRGFGFVELSNVEDAKKLLAEMPVIFLGERRIFIQKYQLNR